MLSGKISILIIDDNPGYSRRMASLLNDTGDVSRVDLAHNYADAEGLLARQPDLVLLDINMPGPNGMQVLKTIKQKDASCNVIMMSNHTEDHYREQCRKLGADLFLDKTYEFHLLPGILKSMQN